MQQKIFKKLHYDRFFHISLAFLSSLDMFLYQFLPTFPFQCFYLFKDDCGNFVHVLEAPLSYFVQYSFSFTLPFFA